MQIPASTDREPSYSPPLTNLQHPEIGVPYPMGVSTHCGLLAVIDDWPWIPVKKNYDANISLGFNDDQGSNVLTDPTHAIYTTSDGDEIHLRRWRSGKDPEIPPCA
jgi:hypothetical protein